MADVDIAVEGVTGAQFATEVAAQANSQGIGTSSVGVVRANPDQSKHLETATVSFWDQAVDFAQLRSEEYANTRIPETKPGTPLEDAQRRDLTVNSLFYNLHTGEVEDFTGQGLPDLRARTIRTPIEPELTFLEDPLRVLRAVRFAAQLTPRCSRAPLPRPSEQHALPYSRSLQSPNPGRERFFRNATLAVNPSAKLYLTLPLHPHLFCTHMLCPQSIVRRAIGPSFATA